LLEGEEDTESASAEDVIAGEAAASTDGDDTAAPADDSGEE
jgi:hypothetical protein